MVAGNIIRRFPAVAAGMIAALFWANTGVLSLTSPSHPCRHLSPLRTPSWETGKPDSTPRSNHSHRSMVA